MKTTDPTRRRFLHATGQAVLASMAGGADAVFAAPAQCAGTLVYFASLGGGPNSGITAARLDAASGSLCSLGTMTPMRMATWVLSDPTRPILYVSTETGGPESPGLASYRINSGTGALSLIDRVVTGGMAPTHLSLDRPSRTIFVAHWGSGHVSAMAIDARGAVQPAASIVRDQGSGPGPSQDGPRSHATALDPGGRFLIVADYGADCLFIYRFDAATRSLSPSDPPFQQMRPGSAPRHLVFHPNGRFLYAVEELRSEVAVYGWQADLGRLTPIQSFSTIAAGYGGRNAAAEILFSPDGAHLYVSNRGEDAIICYAVDGRTGLLSERNRTATGGKTPRAFAIAPTGQWMLVANQDSNEVRVFARNPVNGTLRQTENRIATELPVGIAFAP